MLLPAAAFACGASLAFHLPSLPLVPLVALALLGFALRRPPGMFLACLALGLLITVLRLDLPGSPVAGIDRDKPVEATVRVAGHWVPNDDGWSAPARVLRLKQGSRIVTPSLEAILYVPDREEAAPAFGSTLRIKGYLTRSAGFANRVAVPPGPWRLRVKSRRLMEVEEGPGRIAGLSVEVNFSHLR